MRTMDHQKAEVWDSNQIFTAALAAFSSPFAIFCIRTFAANQMKCSAACKVYLTFHLVSLSLRMWSGAILKNFADAPKS